MAHTRQDTLTAPPEWWRHLRPFNKRRVAKRERRAAVKLIASTREDSLFHRLAGCKNPTDKRSLSEQVQ